MDIHLSDKDLIFTEFAIFADIGPDDRRFIQERVQFAEYKKGACVYQEGDAPNAFFGVVYGRVMLYTRDRHGARSVLEYLHRGKYFGIISLLTDEQHSVTAEALNDCLLLRIEKKDFDDILRKVPCLALDLSRTLSRRLKRKDIHQKTVFESTIIAVYSSYPHAGKTVYAFNLAVGLSQETGRKVVVLDVVPAGAAHTLPGRIGLDAGCVCDLSDPAQDTLEGVRAFLLHDEGGVDIVCFSYRQDDESACVRRLIGIISLLVNDYHYLVLDMPALCDRQIADILHQSDEIHTLTSPEDYNLKRTHTLIRQLKERGFAENKIRIIINEYAPSSLSLREQEALLDADTYAILPYIDCERTARIIIGEPQAAYSRAVRAIARRVGERRVGLVLGVGAGYGFCHIGVLKVIEEENIPIDVIVGSSMGAVIAGLWAMGSSGEEILRITAGEFREPRHIWNIIDLTLPGLGFIKGKRLQRFLNRHLGGAAFCDTKIPLKIVASDVKRKEPRVFEKGPLVDAIMASCAMPGIFLPFRIKDDLLFDGGMVHPLPTEVLLKDGVRKIIAVNVTPSREDIMRQYEKLKSQVSVTGLRLPFRRGKFIRIKDRFKTNILDIIFSSVEMLQSEVARREAQYADIVLHPDTGGLYWLELHKSREFARRGEEEARRNIEAIRRLIAE